MKSKQKARLENWLTFKGIDGKLHMQGKVYGHPRFDDGEFIYTSEIVKVDTIKKIAETLNTHYTLGVAADTEKEPNWN